MIYRFRAAVSGVLLLAVAACTAAPPATPAQVPTTVPAQAPSAQPAAPSAASASPSSAPAAAASPSAAPSAPAVAGVAPGQMKKIKIGFSATAVSMSPLWVAKEAGILERNGLDAELQYVQAGAAITSALVSGDIQVADDAGDSVVAASLGGSDVVIVGSGPNRLLFTIYAGNGINSLADLKGKKLGVTRNGSASDFAARRTLIANGLQPNADVPIVAMGGYPEILSGLQAGAIDAGVLSPPNNFTAGKNGQHLVVDISQQDIPFYQAALVVRSSWEKDNPDVVQSLLKSYIEALVRMQADPATAQAAVSKYTSEKAPDILSKSVDAILKITPRDQTPQIDAIKTILLQAADANPKAASADPAQFIDPAPMQTLIKTGFLDTLPR